MTSSGLTVRALRVGEDLEAEADLRHRAFGSLPDDHDDWLASMQRYVAESRLYGAWDGDYQVGAALYLDMRQWWNGKSIPNAGVGGVKVAPEARGRGVGKALMTRLLDTMVARGYPLSALYPATPHLYRSLGWELAGSQYLAEMPSRALAALRPPDAHAAGQHTDAEPAGRPMLRRAGPQDADDVVATLGAVHAATRDCGPCTEDPENVRRWLADPRVFAYLAPDGFLAYSWHGGSSQVQVHVLQAVSAQTVRGLWQLVGTHASIADTVRAYVGPADPITWLTSELDVRLRRHHMWMLRVLDAQAAIAGRGYPAGTSVSVPLRLTDPQLPANTGRYLFTVSTGQGSLERCDTGGTRQAGPGSPVSLGPRGFAAMFAGTPMAALRGAGLAAGGDPDADAALDAAFAAQPYLLYYF